MAEQIPFDIIKAKYCATAVKAEQYPEGDFPEIAFISRSNVGKSSLINSLCRYNGLARISCTPGKTQTINFYKVTFKISDSDKPEFFLVDLPGYGYARAGQTNKKQWAGFINQYITESSRLKLVCQLIDIRHAPMDSDIQSYRWLQDHNVPVQIIATKADKIAKGNFKKHTGIIKQNLGLQTDEIIPYSTLKGFGRQELLAAIGRVLLNS
jgi:GTP-binding protein